jgi:adenine-specific DNA methylase
MNSQYPKRLIEVDLPIKRISEHARREKSIRHGHISTLHIWWARRPLAACRAVLCAALWPDPADPLCPEGFREAARQEMLTWSKNHLKLLSYESVQKFIQFQKNPELLADSIQLRLALLSFIADFANWDNSCEKEYLKASRSLTQAAHYALGGIPGTRPLVVDPFAGGGAIPLETLRVGADAFASDLNPVAVLLNKVVLDYAPRLGIDLSKDVRKWGNWVHEQACKEIFHFYPGDPDGSVPIAYLWARTIACEGPGCGANLPLVGQVWLSTKGTNTYSLGMKTDVATRSIRIHVLKNPNRNEVMLPIARKGSATCPICGFTTPLKSVRSQLVHQNGGSTHSRLLAVVTIHRSKSGKRYRDPNDRDLDAIAKTYQIAKTLENEKIEGLPIIPSEACPPEGALGFRFQKYGILKWKDLYTTRQLVSLCTLTKIIKSKELSDLLAREGYSEERQKIILTCLALILGRVNDLSASLCRWTPSREVSAAANGGQNKMPKIFDFAESNPISGAGGSWNSQVDWVRRVLEHLSYSSLHSGVVRRVPAQESILPDSMASALVTDPPYYDAFGYSDLSEFFFPWLRRAVPKDIFDFVEDTVPKKEELVSIGKKLNDGRGEKTDVTYHSGMTLTLNVSKKVIEAGGIGIVIFANKTTIGWEAFLQSVVDAGWIVTASWPIETERPNRQRAINSAALGSSIHLVCRPREDISTSSEGFGSIGDWRDVLQELPKRIDEWLPRLAEEGIVGADAIFSCLGPALEIFSRYSKVEKASGEQVLLREYLESVWASVSKAALNMIFEGADATGFEEDARLTAMWLWTISTGTNGNGTKSDEPEDEEPDEDEAQEKTAAKINGFVLEYDAARKIAQGLGAHLENLTTLVEIKGGMARLLPVSDRADYLFNKKADQNKAEKQKAKTAKQLSFADVLGKPQQAANPYFEGEKINFTSAKTTLDRVHQSMLLFAMGESGYLKRLLVEEGAGIDPKFWQLAQALSALYPSHTSEKRWIDGVMARKKTLGL